MTVGGLSFVFWRKVEWNHFFTRINGKSKNAEAGKKEPKIEQKPMELTAFKEEAESVKKNIHEVTGRPENQVNSNQKRMVGSFP